MEQALEPPAAGQAPRVDFYVIGDPGPGACERMACRLAEKAWRQTHRVFLHAVSSEQAERLDELLWTFRADSFVPHALSGRPEAEEVAVLIGGGEPAFRTPGERSADVLINLAETVPPFYERFGRVAEVVGASEAQRRLARERFRYYRERGCQVASHKV